MVTQNVFLSNAQEVNTKSGAKFDPGFALISLSGIRPKVVLSIKNWV